MSFAVTNKAAPFPAPGKTVPEAPFVGILASVKAEPVAAGVPVRCAALPQSQSQWAEEEWVTSRSARPVSTLDAPPGFVDYDLTRGHGSVHVRRKSIARGNRIVRQKIPGKSGGSCAQWAIVTEPRRQMRIKQIIISFDEPDTYVFDWSSLAGSLF